MNNNIPKDNSKVRKEGKKSKLGFKGDWRNNSLLKMAGMLKTGKKNLAEDIDNIYLRD